MEKGPSACEVCCTWWGSTPPGHFLGNRSANTFNLVFAHLLWWSLAFPLALNNGYVTTNYEDAIAAGGTYGEIASGKWGQGSIPIICFVTLVATGIWLEGLVSKFWREVLRCSVSFIVAQCCVADPQNSFFLSLSFFVNCTRSRTAKNLGVVANQKKNKHTANI